MAGASFVRQYGDLDLLPLLDVQVVFVRLSLEPGLSRENNRLLEAEKSSDEVSSFVLPAKPEQRVEDEELFLGVQDRLRLLHNLLAVGPFLVQARLDQQGDDKYLFFLHQQLSVEKLKLARKPNELVAFRQENCVVRENAKRRPSNLDEKTC